MTTVTANAQARVGLLGNPSDLYGGRGLGFAIADMGALVTLDEDGPGELPNELLGAGWRLMSAELEQLGVDPTSRPFLLTFESNVPFQSGLAGSSAILTAALRAWCRWFDVPLSPSHIARLAWRTEVDELGIRAGALDRLVQAHEGLVAMDFRRPFEPDSVERLDPGRLPLILIAWHGEPGEASGDVHAGVYARWEAGDAAVTHVMEALASNAETGREALLANDGETFLGCINRNFDLRAELFEIRAADRELIELGRRMGIATKFPGSGGAVLFACYSPGRLHELTQVLLKREIKFITPNVARPSWGAA